MLVGISGTKEDGRGREGSQLQTAEISFPLSVVLLVEKGDSVGSLKGLFFRGGVRFVVSHLRQPSFPEIGGGEFFFLP